MNQFAGKICLLFCFCFVSMISVHSQEEKYPVAAIQKLISQDSLEKAKTIVGKNIERFKGQKQYDSLFRYIQFEGSIKMNGGDKKEALRKAETLVKLIKPNASPHFVVEALTELGWIYDDLGQHQKAYNLLESAMPYAVRNREPKNTDPAGVHYKLGYYASKIGDFKLANSHYQKSLKLLIKSGKEDWIFYNQIYNALGGMMWQEAKLDSTKYYFQEAVKVLEKTDENDIMNRYFRPALIKLNLSIVWNALGKNNEAILLSEESIAGYQEYINRSTDESRILKAKRNQCVVMDNMGSFYNTLGEHSRALQLIEYSFEQKKKLYEANDINLIISNIILAEAKIAFRDFEGAAENADAALKLLDTSPSADFYWHAAALSARATIYESLDDVDLGLEYYEKADKVFRKAMGNAYTKDFLDNIIDYSLFAAKSNKREKALALAQETYEFTHQGDFKNTLQEFYHTNNLAQVHFILKNYAEALKYSKEALAFKVITQGAKTSVTDSILNQYRKPQALLIHASSKYYLNENRDPTFLMELLEELKEGIAILEQRKKVVNNYEDVNLLINENRELIRFAEKLRLELYNLTCEEVYLDKLIALHESSIYNRIRTRLNLHENIAFQHIPDKVREREKFLRNKLVSSLNDSQTTDIAAYFEATENWETFLDSLKGRFPKYYKMRYSTLERPINDLQEKIPGNTTVIRYVFIDDRLYAFVVSSTLKELILLDYPSVRNHIADLNNKQYSPKETGALLFDLYQVLWSPLKTLIKTEKIVIVPDRELFNLSFGTLTPTPIKNFGEMATNSLLALYDISYNFSLLLYKDKGSAVNYSSEYIAFAPGFTNKMKDDYQLAIKDSTKLDKSYLTLLPQPFSEKLAQDYSRIFDGEYYINENASKELFIRQAQEHKIIHIGTHAESNNISPERSRLIFAKKMDASGQYNENSLYAFEIYTMDLSSNLAILTACETGKPSYQAGEGMISLAHAFNYAGSESILTSLWNIDEVSSTKIVGYFYEYLAEGLPKDKALRKAKLKYLTSVEGRGESPIYWAGLVLVGDSAPIPLQGGTLPMWPWIMGIGFLSIALFYLFRRWKKIAKTEKINRLTKTV